MDKSYLLILSKLLHDFLCEFVELSPSILSKLSFNLFLFLSFSLLSLLFILIFYFIVKEDANIIELLNEFVLLIRFDEDLFVFLFILVFVFEFIKKLFLI